MNKNEKAEIMEMIEEAITRAGMQTLNHGQVVKQTSILHYFNLVDKGKTFLKSTANLGLAVVDAGLALPISIIKQEIIVPSLDCDSLITWFKEDEKKGEEDNMQIISAIE